MKKIFILLSVITLFGCSHVNETIIGYNEQGKTIVRVCHSRGNLRHAAAFGSDCMIELRDYGKVTNSTDTINVISND